MWSFCASKCSLLLRQSKSLVPHLVANEQAGLQSCLQLLQCLGASFCGTRSCNTWAWPCAFGKTATNLTRTWLRWIGGEVLVLVFKEWNLTTPASLESWAGDVIYLGWVSPEFYDRLNWVTSALGGHPRRSPSRSLQLWHSGCPWWLQLPGKIAQLRQMNVLSCIGSTQYASIRFQWKSALYRAWQSLVLAV